MAQSEQYSQNHVAITTRREMKDQQPQITSTPHLLPIVQITHNASSTVSKSSKLNIAYTIRIASSIRGIISS
jgi:hypothetical protein